MRKTVVIILCAIVTLFPQKRALTIEDLWAMQRVGTAELSPAGDKIVFTLASYSMDLNKGNTDIYIINTDGSGLKPVVNSEKNETAPKFTPDGKKISYILESQLYLCNLDGSEAKKVTDIYSGINDYTWSRDGKNILFVSSVYPECSTMECNETRDKAKENSKVKASIFTELMYRHWNNWRGEKRSHLFFHEIGSDKYIDLTAHSTSDVPPIALYSTKDFTFSPDGAEVAFTMNPDKVLALSTNNEIFLLTLSDYKEGKKSPLRKISVSPGNDNQPVYSPDGRYIAYCSMARAGFEADKQRIMIYDREKGITRELGKNLDRSAQEIIWSPDGKYIYFTAQNSINETIYRIDVLTDRYEIVLEKGMNSNILINNSGTKLFYKKQKTTLPFELFSLDIATTTEQQLTTINQSRLNQIEMNPAETFTVKGAGGTPVQSILIKPPFFDATKKYPMIFLIHGGPQGAWSDEFHYRWNVQMFAAEGYVVVATNPRGSTGYGQKFTDEISGDWGGKVYTDLMNSYDYVVKNFSFIDKNNTFAAGASYGGYMINWIAGHTDRFNALVSHAGVFNLESMYGTTEELWFPEWENKGTPWSNRKLYENFSPHRYIQNCKTPVLVVHGAYDFRVPEEQAFQLFTSLQRLGIESKFLYFPDETHFVAKPQNAKLWWTTVFDWFRTHRK